MWRNWDPIAQLDALRREVDRVFTGYAPAAEGRGRSLFLPGLSARSYPLVNLYETTDGVDIEALAPGLDPASINVTVRSNALEISGEKQPLDGVPRQAVHRSERATGRFVRVIGLDTEIDEAGVTASYERGILSIHLPRDEKAKPRQISVSVN